MVTLPDGKVSKTVANLDKLTPLQLALAPGHYWLTLLESGRAANLAELAKQVGKDNTYVSRMVNLTMLAPDIVATLLDESLLATVTLFMLASNTPLLRDEQ